MTIVENPNPNERLEKIAKYLRNARGPKTGVVEQTGQARLEAARRQMRPIGGLVINPDTARTNIPTDNLKI
ncbi:hypothetical protein A2686_02855 [Candidatus Woesebacteria bacterium RIFCSPHIGHO2_01_FULL_38_10]|uniref:Uncharacterized protein n=1 Tax=Candidatus Woesebacteria bacterium RIFCSPLOWO2_01_FULL_39_10b TaxID=1802517 RepID=A0A1F8BA04_9BACT|nr:MAG: hypothetical protein A2686_02855 [Candidatus Woesebacteria bacterium RIFCSPHIGHO2_01_FULL_38_10]OGM60499.1 MAG: hypothetical protein A2892_00545 [Candidatus Woesebacteria bacterium RIFCSPLOWO2_01_FULL_39_10b]